jgi:hypothetical protein
MKEMRNEYKYLLQDIMRKYHERPRSREEDNVITDVGKLKDKTVDYIQRHQNFLFVNTVMNNRFPYKMGNVARLVSIDVPK